MNRHLSALVPSGFGGSRLKSHPKVARPFSAQRPSLVVLRSRHARGPHSFILHGRSLERLARRLAARGELRILGFANGGHHLQIVVRARHRQALANFLRVLSGLIVRRLWNAERGRPCRNAAGGRFWDGRPFSSIVNDSTRDPWRQKLRQVVRHLRRHSLEPLGEEANERYSRTLGRRVERMVRECKLVPLGFSAAMVA